MPTLLRCRSVKERLSLLRSASWFQHAERETPAHCDASRISAGVQGMKYSCHESFPFALDMRIYAYICMWMRIWVRIGVYMRLYLYMCVSRHESFCLSYNSREKYQKSYLLRYLEALEVILGPRRWFWVQKPLKMRSKSDKKTAGKNMKKSKNSSQNDLSFK